MISSLFPLACPDLYTGKHNILLKFAKIYNSWNLLDELSSSNGLKSHEHQENTIYNAIQFDHYYNLKNKTQDFFVGSSNDKYVKFTHFYLFKALLSKAVYLQILL